MALPLTAVGKRRRRAVKHGDLCHHGFDVDIGHYHCPWALTLTIRSFMTSGDDGCRVCSPWRIVADGLGHWRILSAVASEQVEEVGRVARPIDPGPRAPGQNAATAALPAPGRSTPRLVRTTAQVAERRLEDASAFEPPLGRKRQRMLSSPPTLVVVRQVRGSLARAGRFRPGLR